MVNKTVSVIFLTLFSGAIVQALFLNQSQGTKYYIPNMNITVISWGLRLRSVRKKDAVLNPISYERWQAKLLTDLNEFRTEMMHVRKYVGLEVL